MTLRLAHFTDIHITQPPGRIAWRQLLSKRALGWVNLKLMGRYSRLTDAAAITRAVVRDLDRLEPDHILTTGDHTGLALPSEFRAAREALSPLFRSDKVTSVPGNHDLYVRSAVESELYEEWFGEWTRTDLEVDDFPSESRAAFPYPLVRFLDTDVVLICLRDARPVAFYDSSGRVPGLQLRALEHVLCLPEVSRRVKVLALHYGLFTSGGSRDTYFHGLRNASSLLELAERAHVALVVHGHIHDRFVHPQGAVSSLAVANPGALTCQSGSRAYHVYHIDRDRIRLEARRYNAEQDTFQPWPEAPGSGVVSNCGAS